MATAKEVKAKFTADTKELTSAVTQANSVLSKLRSEMRLVSTQTKATGDTMDTLKQRQSILTQEMQQSQAKIDALTQKLDKARDAFGDTSPEVQRLETQLTNARVAMAAQENELSQVSASLSEMEEESRRASSAMGQLESTISQQESKLSGLKDEYNRLAMEQGEGSDRCRELAREIQDVSSELDENRGKLQQAESAADRFDRTMDSAGDSAKDFGNDIDTATVAIGNLIADIASRAIDAIADLSGEVMSASDALDKFSSTMSFAGFDASTIESAKTQMKTYADQTVYDLNTVMNTTAQLAANGINDFTGLTQAAGNLTAAAGGGAEAFDSVAMMLTQTAGAGKLTTENWNQLADAIPGASGVLQEAMRQNGAYTGNFREAMEKGEITADEFNQAIMQLGNQPVAVEAARSTETFEGSLGNLEAAAINTGTALIDYLGKDNITGVLNGITGAIEWLTQNLNIVIPVLAGVAAGFVAFQVITVLVPAVTALVAGIGGLAGVMALLTSPVTLVVAAIALLTAGFVALWNSSETFRNGVTTIWTTIQTVFGTLAEWFMTTVVTPVVTYFQSLWPTIQTIFTQIQTLISTVMSAISGFISSNMGTIQSIWSVVWGGISAYASAIWSTIQAVINTALGVIQGIITTVTGIISGDWSMVWEGISQVASSIWNGIQSTISGIIDAIASNIEGVFNGVKGTVEGIWNGIKGAIDGAINGAADIVSGAIDTIKGVMNFNWSLPKLKLPHISISGSFSLTPPSVPHFGIEWYAKGGILEEPTIFGMNGGNAMVGGEAGPEAVAPIGDLLGYMIEALDAKFGSSDASGIIDAIEDLADRVISIEIDGKQLARATASDADRVNGSRQNLVRRGVALP